MNTETFVATVREIGRLDSDADARATTDGTLEALSESIPRGLAENIAEQLPEELAEHLLVEETEDAHPPDYEAFLSQVSETADFDRGFAQARVQTVIAALEQTLDEFEYENLRSTLPEEYAPLFETDAVGGSSLVETSQVATGLDSLAPAEMQRARDQLGPDYSSLI